MVNRAKRQVCDFRFFQLRKVVFGDFMAGFKQNFACCHVDDVLGDITADHVFVLHQDFFQTIFFEFLQLARRQLCALFRNRLTGLRINKIRCDLLTAHALCIKRCLPAFFVFGVQNTVVEDTEDFFVGHTLDHQRIDLLILLHCFFAVCLGIGRIERAQECRQWQLPAAVDAHIHMVFRIKLEVEPRATVRNNARSEKILTRHVCLPAIVIEEHTRRAVHLGDNHALCAVHDKGTIIGHQRHVDHVDVLLFNVANGTQAGILVHIEHRQTECHAQRCRVGNTALNTFFHIVFRLFEFVGDVINLCLAGEIGNWENGGENFFEAMHETIRNRHARLQEVVVRLALHLNQVWHLRYFTNTAKITANFLTACEALNRVRNREFNLIFGF